jgi:hypothetical protein
VAEHGRLGLLVPWGLPQELMPVESTLAVGVADAGPSRPVAAGGAGDAAGDGGGGKQRPRRDELGAMELQLEAWEAAEAAGAAARLAAGCDAWAGEAAPVLQAWAAAAERGAAAAAERAAVAAAPPAGEQGAGAPEGAPGGLLLLSFGPARGAGDPPRPLGARGTVFQTAAERRNQALKRRVLGWIDPPDPSTPAAGDAADSDDLAAGLGGFFGLAPEARLRVVRDLRSGLADCRSEDGSMDSDDEDEALWTDCLKAEAAAAAHLVLLSDWTYKLIDGGGRGLNLNDVEQKLMLVG